MQTAYRNATTLNYETVVTEDMLNAFHTFHGGSINYVFDEMCGRCAYNYCEGEVTSASFHNTRIFQPAFLGDIITGAASVIYTGKTSLMTMGHLYRQATPNDTPELIAESYISMVHIDSSRRRLPVRPLPLADAAARAQFDKGTRIVAFSKSLESI